MTWERIEHNWRQFRTKAKQVWSRLTEYDLDLINGDLEQLVGVLKNRYGFGQQRAEQEAVAFRNDCV